MNHKIPVFIITGFLGSGKTTLLVQLLQYCAENGLRPAVILNELGEINVEKHLFKDHDLIELLNGCICCTIKDDLTKELHQFLQSIPSSESSPDIIFVEGTGVANPNEVFDGLIHPLLADSLEVLSIISLVDACRFLDYQSIFASSKEIRKILKEQITQSSVVILNKIDLLQTSKLEKVRKKLHAMLDSRILVQETTYSQVNVEDLLKPRIINHTVHIESDSKYHSHHEHSDHAHSDHEHSHGLFQTVNINQFGPLKQVQLDAWIKNLPESVVRAKGMVELDGKKGWFQFQYSSNQLHLEPVNKTQFHPSIIIIGHHLNIAAIEQSFKENVGI